MPVTMATSSESKSEVSTQELPTIPTVQVMKTWDTEKVLRWIHQRDPNILKEDDVNNFKKARIAGGAFLAPMLSSIKLVACLVESV
jgi:hypothetical protein